MTAPSLQQTSGPSHELQERRDSMDYSFFSAQPQQFSYNGTSGNSNVQSIYGMPDSSITADSELFRGLNSIGSHFDAFSPFNPTDQFLAPQSASSALKPAPQHPTQQQQQQQQQQQPPQTSQPLQAPKSLSPESSHDESGMPSFESGFIGRPRQQSNGLASTEASDRQELNRASSEERDPNSMPAQDRRKAQNRAAQRAFRERKERHVKELEAKLQSLSDASSSLQSDNERLKRELAALSTQNEILLATHARPASRASSRGAFQQPPRVPSPTLGPQTFTPTDFIVATGNEAATQLRFEAYPNPRGRMLLAGAAWDLIVRDKRVHMGQVNLEEVCRRLKGTAICDGRGPAFRDEDIRRILDECSVGGVSDDLL